MNKNFLKRLWSLIVLLTAGLALADAASIEIPAVNINRNGTASVQLSINDGSSDIFDYQGFQFDLFLPDGITLQSSNLSEALISANFSITVTNPATGTYRFIAYAPMNHVDAAQFLTLELAADNTVTTGTQTAKIQNVIFSAPDGQDIPLSNSETSINIKVPVTSITLNKSEITLIAGTEFQLVATLAPSDSSVTDISWTSSDTAVATVGNDGTVIALKAGTTVVTATCDGITADCTVTVKEVNSGDDDIKIVVTPGEGTDEGDEDDTPGENTAEGGSLIGNDLTLRVGQTASINLSVTPTPEYDPALQWALESGGDTFVTMSLTSGNSLTASFTGVLIGEARYTVNLPKNGGQLLTGKIKVIAANPVSAIQISPENLTLELNDSPVQLTATVAPDNATIKTVTWSSSNPGIAAVSPDGKVSPVAEGDCDIIATVEDGNGITAVCKVKVIPVQPRSIAIDGDNIHALKTTGTLQLTATITPEDCEYTDVTWTTSSEDLATVSDDGLVTAVSAGTVTITAYVTGFPDIKDEYEIEITGRLLGDANDNGTVNVADIVTIADYINQRSTWRFSFVNADVDENGDITTADIEGVLNIIKGQAPVPVRMTRRVRAKSEDTLCIDNFVAGNNSVQAIGLTLDNNSHRYSSMQAKILVPEGMEIEDIKLGNAAMNHTLNYNFTEDGKLHLVIYSLDSTPFNATTAPLVKISARANAVSADIAVENIIFSNSDVEEYALSYTGGINTGVATGIEAFDDAAFRIAVFDGNIVVSNAEGLDIEIYSVSGEIVSCFKVATSEEKVSLQTGMYVVKVGGKTAKVVL